MTCAAQDSAAGRASATAGKMLWQAAMRWRRSVETELARVHLTFAQWLVLDAIDELITESDDAVSQAEVSLRIDLDKTAVSRVMSTISN